MDLKEQREFSKARRGECACANVRKAGRALTRLYDEELRPSGLRITQYGILGVTMAMEPVTVTHLAEETVTDRTTLTRNLKILEDRGFISIREGNDRREREVSLTTEGREALKAAYPFWKKAQARVMKELGDRWDSLREGLAALVDLSRE
ncbi:MAG: MarR family winged helix-turn-helix transcriptional regulator [Blastocatellia bacterium]